MTPGEITFIKRRLWATAKKRAKAKGREFTITKEDIHWPEGGLCPVLLVPLKKHEGKLEDDTPTLDRIDDALGYIPGNVRIVSWRVNFVKRSLTNEQIERLYLYSKGEI